MNLVEKVARMLDQEGAYAVYRRTVDGERIPLSTRQKYFQAHYEHLAVDILKLMLAEGLDSVRTELIEFEKQGWRSLGVPIDDPRLCAAADEVIRKKYAAN